MKICKLDKNYIHLIDDFSCGNDKLDKFIKSSDAFNPDIGVTYIMLSDDEDYIIGYYNISVGRIDYVQHISELTNVYEPMGGAFHINYLCVHKNFQRQIQLEKDNKKIYIGDILLLNCEDTILSLNQYVGASFITLFSTKQGSHLYKNRNGYELFENDMITIKNPTDAMCYKMYKCIEEIR